MKNAILTLVLSFLCLNVGFSQFNLGAGGQLITDDTIFGIQGKALFEINDQFDAAGTFTFHLDDNADWTIDLDAHYTLLEISESFNIAPLAGLSITSEPGNTAVGLNLGGFFDFIMGEKERHIYIEPKVILGGVSSFVISAGLML